MAALVEAQTSRWASDAVAMLRQDAATTIPVIDAVALAAAKSAWLRDGQDGSSAALDLWDMWPLQLADGATAKVAGGSLWMILSAPVLADSNLRHDIARIRLALERGGAWIDCGNALPDGLCPGTREWAGSAVLDPDRSEVTLYFTAAGRRGETRPSFSQRLFETVGSLVIDGEAVRITGWSDPAESLVADGVRYVRVDAATGAPGFIKGFRDPAYFRDPGDGAEYLLFTASIPDAASDWNGAIGIARRDSRGGGGGGSWVALDPLLRVDGLNNELERPHIVARDGLHYLFFSTQRRVFAPDGPNGPNGLYAMVADHVLGPYRPVNGSGLVAANPPDAPYQSYSWWVTGELDVAGFVEMPGLTSDPAGETAAVRRAHFGGVPAPRFQLVLDGDTARVTG